MKNEGIEVKELCADGGPTNNQYLMKFQSSILQIPVKLPKCEVSSAYGAGLMAGISCGFYDPAEIFNGQSGNKFIPSISPGEREQKYQGWKSAVNKVVD